MNNYKKIKIEKKDWGELLLLNRPEKLNALSPQMVTEIHSYLTEKSKTGTDLILIKGAGDAFSSGQDLEAIEKELTPETINELLTKLQEITKLITNYPNLIIAGVDGYAIGAGAEIALNCDLVYASDRSTFKFPEIDVGLSVTQGTSFFLPREIGLKKTKEILCFGEPLTAVETENLGLINATFISTTFNEEVNQKMIQLKNKPQKSLIILKELLNKGSTSSLTESLNLESTKILTLLQ